MEELAASIAADLEYENSPEVALYFEMSDVVSTMLERADVDATGRQIIWEDGTGLSIAATAKRIGAEHREYQLDIIEEHVIEWLESDFVPSTYTPEQFDELDRLTGAWVEDHKRRAKAQQKGSRTRHS
jgi:hypothetical protein